MAEIIKCVSCTRTLEQLRAALTVDPKWYSRSCCPSEGQATVCSCCSYGCNNIWLCCHCWNPTTVIQSPFNAQASLNALNSNPKNTGSYVRGHELLGVINFESYSSITGELFQRYIGNTMQAPAKKMYKLQQRHLQLEERNRQLTALTENLTKRYYETLTQMYKLQQRHLQFEERNRQLTELTESLTTVNQISDVNERFNTLEASQQSTMLALNERLKVLETSRQQQHQQKQHGNNSQPLKKKRKKLI
jgi:hypothetical protein